MPHAIKKKLTRKQASNDTLEQFYLIDIYRALHTKMMDFTFSLRAYGTFSGIDRILVHK